MPFEQEVVMIYAGTRGPADNTTFLDDVPVSRVQEFQNALLQYIDTSASDLRQKLAEKKELTGEIEGQLKQVIIDFKAKAWKK
jgi:F-type H+-transporting ATPase subunit alpha